MSVVGGDSEVETVLKRIRDGEFEIDTARPGAKALQHALQSYRVDKMTCAVPSPHIVKDTRIAIDIAISQGVIKPTGAESFLKKEPGKPEEGFVVEILKLVLTQTRGSVTNIQGNVENLVIGSQETNNNINNNINNITIYNDIVKKIEDANNIP
jgi:hypothetical protein